RSSVHARPPRASIHSICSASSTSVATAGVFRVWFFRELSIALVSERKDGIHREESRPSRCARSSAAGERTLSHRPPSEAKAFWEIGRASCRGSGEMRDGEGDEIKEEKR